MFHLVEALLFLLPIAAYLLWLRFNPGRAVGVTVSGHVLALAALGIALAAGAAAWYGLSRGMAPGSTYVPARIAPGGIEPGHAAPGRGEGR